MRQGLPGVKFRARLRVIDRRALDVVEQPLYQVGGGSHVLQPLLILDADGVAAEVVRDTHGSDVHLALFENLAIGQVGFLVGAGDELHAPRVEPVAHLLRFLVAHQAHGRHQRRLTESLLVDAGGVEQLVVNDGVVHAHAALVEDAQDGFLALELRGQRFAQLTFRGGQAGGIEVAHVAGVVIDLALANPLADAAPEELVGEVFAPDGAVFDAGLGQRAVEVEHAHQAGPLPAPVGDGEDRATMVAQTGQHMMAVLPHRFGDDQTSVGINVLEDLHAHALTGDEAVLLHRIVGMPAFDGDALFGKGSDDGLLHRFLGRPADLIGGQAQVAAGN